MTLHSERELLLGLRKATRFWPFCVPIWKRWKFVSIWLWDSYSMKYWDWVWLESRKFWLN